MDVVSLVVSLVVVVSLAGAYRVGYREGLRAGEMALQAYQAGLHQDGGCWIKRQSNDPSDARDLPRE